MIAFLSKGGVLVGPILLCSVIALAIFLERLIRFALVCVDGNGVPQKVATHMKNGEDHQAYELASSSATPIGRILTHAIEVKDQDRETLETVIVHSTGEEIRLLSRYLQALATIGNIAPLLVIQQMGGKVNAAVLAGGIWEAMLTTALGLAVALPTMVAHSYLISRVDRFEARLQDGAVTFLKALQKRP